MNFKLLPLALPEVLLIEHERATDERGFFAETFRADAFAALGVPTLVQDNTSRSMRGVLRGLHYQLPPAALGKLVRCVRGAIFDVAVDIRRGSPTFGKWVGVDLTETNNRMVWIPAGFAHGFCATSELADISYRMSGYYSPAHERCIAWCDPDLAIEWPTSKPRVSARDAAAPGLHAAENTFTF